MAEMMFALLRAIVTAAGMVIHRLFCCAETVGVTITNDCDPQLLHEQQLLLKHTRNNRMVDDSK